MEIQALVTDNTSFGFPRREASGMDYKRVSMLMAVLEKRIGLRLSQSDAYVNIAGGMRVSEPATDLAVVMAVISSFSAQPQSSGNAPSWFSVTSISRQKPARASSTELSTIS